MEHFRTVTSEWCDIREAAKHLAVSTAFLRKRVRLREIPYARAGKVLRFRKADLDRWLEANGCGGEIH